MNDLKIDIDLKPVKNIVKQFAEAVKATLKRNGSYASGNLYNSIKGIVKTSETVIEISISMEDYWEYIEYGTPPHYPPISVIRKWISIKPVLPRPMKNGKLPTPEQLPYVIQTIIGKYGTKPKPFLNNTYDDFNFEEKLYNVIIEEINKKINEEIQNDLG